MSTNPILGIFFHSIGGFAAGSFYIPLKKVKNWAWESYWLVNGLFAWIIVPILVAQIAVPNLWSVLTNAPINNIIWSYIFGVLWGIGGLTFGLTMRYLGMSLGMAMALGLTAIFGTVLPPIYFGNFSYLMAHLSGLVTLGGVMICILGIAVCGWAGLRKDREQSDEEKKQSIQEFDFKKGIWVAFFAGIMSACFAFGIAAGKPIAELAVANNTLPLFQNSPVFVVILLGGFTTNFTWCLLLNIKNKSIGDYFSKDKAPLFTNYFFSALAGITWYFQFMFYGMGTTQMGKYDFVSWSIHMAFIITFSNMWGLILHEWRGSQKSTIRIISGGLLILVFSTIVIGLGSYLQKFE
jgi:L-rhamnose-H+ transport protein